MRPSFFKELLDEKDLFAATDSIVSMAERFFIDVLGTMPKRFDKRKKIAAPCIDYYDSQYKNLELWKNPELFKATLDYVTSNDNPKIHLNNLWRQLGITTTMRCDDSIVRTYHYQKCFIVDKKRIALDDNNCFPVTHRGGSSEITFVHPLKGIFADFISSSIYPVEFVEKKRVKINNQIKNATDLVFNYSNEAYSEFFKLISYVFLTPDFGDSTRFSYNLRTQYFGSFFINPFQTTTVSFAESILHELIHQHLWMQWAYTFPDLTAYEKIPVVSPFSNREKSLVVMTQAYIIYSVISDFRQFLIDSNQLSKKKQEEIQESTRTENEKLFLLYSRLIEKMPTYCPLKTPLKNTRDLFNDIKHEA
jgi:hypothetical protein